jgi:DNA recombination protein RmuC
LSDWIFAVGLAAVGLLAWLIGSARTRAIAAGAQAKAAAAEAREAELRQQLQAVREENRSLAEQAAAAEQARAAAEARAVQIEKNIAEQRDLLEQAKAKLSETFRSLAAEALSGSNKNFLVLAEEKFRALKDEAAGRLAGLIQPLTDTLAAYQKETKELQEKRGQELGSVGQQLRAVAETEAALRAETAKLVQALQSHRVRGRWGEITLRRTAELAGMSPYCDFAEQERAETGDGHLRPDMIVRLPAGRSIVVDSKAPLDAFLEAMEALTDQDRETALQRYASQVRSHVMQLASKQYWAQFPSAPEFVVLFIPNDSFLGAAAERDRSLIETALNRRVVFATPTTLFALLFAIERGWRQDQISQNAERVSQIGQELYDRMATLADHLIRVGGSLGKAVESYNAAVNTIEGRILPSARRFKELGAAGKKEIDVVPTLDQTVRRLQEPELETPK